MFKDQSFGRSHAIQHQPSGMAQIREESDVTVVGTDQKTDWILRIMWNGESFHFDIPNLKGLACVKYPAVELSLGLTGDRIVGQAVGVEWYPQFGCDHL